MPTLDPTITVTCLACGESYETLQSKARRRQCPKCAKKADDAKIRKRIPPIYFATDRTRIPAKLLKFIEAFDIEGSTGLYLSGPVGRCKTRAACLLLERYCRDGQSIMFVESTKFAELVRTQFHDDEIENETWCCGKNKSTGQKSRERLKEIKKADALLIDDIGKEKLTERVEVELFALLEYRTSCLLPTIFTSNFAIAELTDKFSRDQRLAIMRRITEFSQCVQV
jgi:DNA replication protein DnaC